MFTVANHLLGIMDSKPWAALHWLEPLHAQSLRLHLAMGPNIKCLLDVPTAFSLLTSWMQFYWRNGWFHRITERETAAGKPDPFPIHTARLHEVGAI